MQDFVVRATNIGHTFSDGTVAIQDVSLTLREGEFVALVGQSGVGKSTLLRIVGGLLRPKSGQIKRTHAADAIGIVFQNYNLMPWRTVTQNVCLPLEIKGNIDPERVQYFVELVGLAGFENSHPAQLSGGMAQRVALARALVHDPDLLLLDEPFGSLDALTRERMAQELLRIRQAHPITVFMVTHSIDEAILLADRVLVLGRRPGTLVADVTIDLPRPRLETLRYQPVFRQYVTQIRSCIGL